MSTFSQRYGYKSSVLQLETASDTLKRRILAAFYKQEFDSYDTFDWANYTTGIEDMMIEMGVPYEFPKNELIKKRNAEALQKYTKTPAKSYKKFEFKPVVESVIKAKFVNDEIELITNETSYFITESEANQLAYAFNSKKPTSIIIDDVQWIVSNRLNESVLKQKDSDVKLKLSQTIIDFIKNV